MSENLKSKVVKGAFWNGLERFGTAFFLFVSNLVLARLLSPDDFGCIGMLMVFISISDAIVDGGFGTALIQKKNVSSADYSTIFFWNLIVSILLYIILFVTAPAIASFYNINTLSTILRVQGIILLLHGLTIVQRSILRKELSFKKLSKINLFATIVGTGLSIICAYVGFGVWSLVVKYFTTSLLVCVLLWTYTSWKPALIISKSSFASLFNFGSFVFLLTVVNSIYQNVISLVIGKALSSATLGYFTQARKLEDIPRETISAVVNNVSFSAFSSVQDDKAKLAQSFRMTTQVLAFINSSVCILLIVVARPLIIFLFTDKWEQSIPYFQVICLYGLIISHSDLSQKLIMATGKGKMLLTTGFVSRSVAIFLICIGAIWGMKGILIGFVLGQYICFAIVSFPLRGIINYSLLDQINDLIPNFLTSILAGVFSYYITTYVLNQFFEFGNNLINIFMNCSIFVIVLLFISSVFKIQSYYLFKGIISKKYLSFNNK